MAEMSIQARFTEYLNVVNRAMGEHRDEFPYKQLLHGAEKLLDDKTVGVAVYQRNPDQPHAWFTIAFEDGTFDLLEQGAKNPDMTWKMPEAHVDEVVENPREYIRDPAKLDLDWLKTRIKITDER